MCTCSTSNDVYYPEQGLRAEVQARGYCGEREGTAQGSRESPDWKGCNCLDKQFAQGKTIFLHGGLQRGRPRDTGHLGVGAREARGHWLTKCSLSLLSLSSDWRKPVEGEGVPIGLSF